MIGRLFGLLALLVLASCGSGAVDVQQGAAPALWAVEDRQGDAIGWLFGTIHALPEDTAWETPPITRAIAAAGMLVVEVRDLDPARTGAVFQRLSRDTPGPPLAQRVPASQRPALTSAFAATALPASSYDGLETWAAALALARLGQREPGGRSVDGALIRRFKGRPVAELEGAARQLAIFDTMPEREQRALLSGVLAERENASVSPDALARPWLAGDLARLEGLMRRGLLRDPALYHTLATERNRAWAAPIAALLAAGRKPLVGVGAAHMIGPEGLPALLEAQGYRVRRIQ